MNEAGRVNQFRPLKDWFSFEDRCLVCGRKYSDTNDGLTWKTLREHLYNHCDEGVLEKNDDGAYRQIKAHPVGFPGILLPKEMEWAR